MINGLTASQIAEKLIQNDTKGASLADTSHSIQEKYSAGLMAAFEKGMEAFPKLNFFIVALARKKPLFENLFEHQVVVGGMCPRPNYDQTVFRFNQDTGNLEHLWTIPDRQLCIDMLEAKAFVPLLEQPLLEYVVKFSDGTLAQWMHEFNRLQVQQGLKLAAINPTEKNVEINLDTTF